jgi:hypothetical protein
VTQLRTNVLLGVLGILAAAVQIISTRWGLIGDLAGGLLCGLIILGGMRVLALEINHAYLAPLVAGGASLLGLAFGIAGSNVTYPRVSWVAPLLAALPTGALALKIGPRWARCQLCHARLRRLLSFSCPRCHLIACENCWEFERGRCHLCETNQVPLFPLEFSWWQERFGSQTHSGRCVLCLRTADGKVAHWPCAGCGHSQCRSCWDDNNGQCSRCGWTIPGLPTDVSEFVGAGAQRVKS